MTISGYATPEKTMEYAALHRPVQFSLLGSTGLTVSPAGFGGYRVTSGMEEHELALRKALGSGINLIDTSANYTDGGSEMLVGEVLKEMITSGKLSREEVVVVSKVGYLQGQNYRLSQERKSIGKPYPDLVLYEQGLEHCIHPESLKDQLDRSLERLGIDTLDCYLLHNPEYYLEWAQKNGASREDAQEKYYQRIGKAFEYLEKEVAKGRIRYYGISSNTFVANSDAIDFTSLEIVLRMAESVSEKHHLGLIQFPMNLLEPGAVLNRNQLNGQNVLQLAARRKLGVLTNRPLNGFTEKRFVRLADIGINQKQDRNEIIRKIRALSGSEKTLWMKILPGLEIDASLIPQIKEQMAVGENLKYYHLNFGSYEKWRQVKDSYFIPRVQGILAYLKEQASESEEVKVWVESHQDVFDKALQAVGSIYAEDASRQIRRLKELTASADKDWVSPASLSQKAVRAVRSTEGVSTVLVGMRKQSYVADVLEEIRTEVSSGERIASWEKISRSIGEFFS